MIICIYKIKRKVNGGTMFKNLLKFKINFLRLKFKVLLDVPP